MSAQSSFRAANLAHRKRLGLLFSWLCLLATVIGIAVLGILLIDVFIRGWPSVNWSFLTSYPSRFPERAGILSALVGSVCILALTALFAFPLGVGAAIYLEEYARKNWLSIVIQINIGNLAGVPSIVYGLLGLGLFVRALNLERSVLAGSLTMALLVLPIIIISAQEAIRAVPPSLREAAYALGATQWQVVRHIVLPSAFSSILTGTILALSRAIGETAPLITIGALTFIAFLPDSLLSPFTVLPIQIFNWVSRPQAGFHERAAAGIIVLLVVLLTVNAAAILLRNKYQGKRQW
ncbi:MAG: Phosphate transport system permease protein PstA [Dehalococcoidia bacterium]|nr:Phosphate transport system permease protein PstA [Dehalococcoidia bacterium]